MKKTAMILAVMLLGTMSCLSQTYRYEVGPALGISGYLGDVNNSNMYKMPRVTGGGIFRYNLNSRFAFKGNLFYVNLAGDSKNIEDKFPFDEHYQSSCSTSSTLVKVPSTSTTSASHPTWLLAWEPKWQLLAARRTSVL